MASGFPYYQMYVDDFDDDDKVRAMSLDEVGLYVLCLNRSWKYGGLADDVEQVSLDVRRKISAVRKSWPAVRSCYVEDPTRPGWIVNPRQEAERMKVMQKSGKAASAARARWSKDADAMRTHSVRYANADADAMPRAYDSVSVSGSKKQIPSVSFQPNCDRVVLEYPREIDDEDMRHFLSFILTPEDEALFFKNLPLYVAGWEARFVPKLENFLRKGTWKVTPKMAKAPGGKTGLDDTLAWLATRGGGSENHQ